jgi:hypothetical protein
VIVVDDMWFAMFCNREMGEDEDEDEGDVVRRGELDAILFDELRFFWGLGLLPVSFLPASLPLHCNTVTAPVMVGPPVRITAARVKVARR